MCGIVALLCAPSPASWDHVVTGVRNLLNRGYDSVGVVAQSSDFCLIVKSADAKDAFQDWLIKTSLKEARFAQCSVFVCHSRWATQSG